MPRLALLLGLLAGSSPAPARDDGTCEAWLAAEQVGVVTDPELDELSGLAASHQYPGVLWTHEDAGGLAAVYALDLSGELLGRWGVLGASNVDWEDIALGPCLPDAGSCSCLYLADSGDNELDRGGGVIYRVPEPEPDGDGQTGLAETIAFRYPDGPHDAEALLVHPETGEAYLLTREEGRSRVYLFPEAPLQPHPEGDPLELVPLATLPLDDWELDSRQLTAADASPRGRRVLLRTNEDVLILAAPEGGDLSDAFFTDPVRRPAPPGDQGEAIAMDPDGRSLYLVQEGEQTGIWEVRCAQFVSDGGDEADPLVDCAAGCSCGGGPSPGSAGLLPALLALYRRRRHAAGKVADRGKRG